MIKGKVQVRARAVFMGAGDGMHARVGWCTSARGLFICKPGTYCVYMPGEYT